MRYILVVSVDSSGTRVVSGFPLGFLSESAQVELDSRVNLLSLEPLNEALKQIPFVELRP